MSFLSNAVYQRILPTIKNWLRYKLVTGNKLFFCVFIFFLAKARVRIACQVIFLYLQNSSHTITGCRKRKVLKILVKVLRSFFFLLPPVLFFILYFIFPYKENPRFSYTVTDVYCLLRLHPGAGVCARGLVRDGRGRRVCCCLSVHFSPYSSMSSRDSPSPLHKGYSYIKERRKFKGCCWLA